MSASQTTSQTWSQVIEALIEGKPGAFKLVLDPAGFTYGEVEASLQDRGWRCLDAATPFDLRCHYEALYRQAAAPETPTLLRLKFERPRIPYDIASQFEPLDLSPAALFPSLQPELLSGLPPAWYLKLYRQAQESAPQARLSAQQTAQHIISVCLDVDLPAFPESVDLLPLLTSLVRQRTPIPPALAALLVSAKLPASLRSALADIQQARDFLQTIWQAYAQTLAAPVQAAEDGSPADLMPWLAPLESDRRVQSEYTQLCQAGDLPLIQLAPEHAPLPAWLQPEVHYQVDASGYLAQALAGLDQEMPAPGADFDEWGAFATRWAGWRSQYRQYRQQAQEIQIGYAQFQQALSANFYAWLKASYGAALRYPYLPRPYCLHQALPYLASRYTPSPSRPLALVVMDGMAWEDWLVLEPLLGLAQPGLRSETLPILAILPTLTSISRQALLSASLPAQFPEHWQTTQYEKTHWLSFWEAHGLRQDAVGYLRGLGKPGTESIENEALSLTSQPNLAAAAFIVNGIDDLIHASALQDYAFQGELLAWANGAGFAAFIQALRQRFATVVITSDHGHITGKGLGRLPLEHLTVEGSLRAALFQPPLEDYALKQLPACLPWRGHGLPDDLMAVFPEGDSLFAPPGEEHISHGGPGLEEVVIPLVIITAEE